MTGMTVGVVTRCVRACPRCTPVPGRHRRRARCSASILRDLHPQRAQLITNGGKGNTHANENRKAPMKSAFAVSLLGAVGTGLGSALGQISDSGTTRRLCSERERCYQEPSITRRSENEP